MTMVTRMLRNILPALVRDEAGTGLIELALVAPIIIFIMLAISDMAQGFTMALQLKQAANRTIELATVAGARTNSYSYLQAEGAVASGQPSSNVVVSAWLECNGVKQSSSATNCSGSAQFARYVSVAITGSYTPAFSSSVMASIYGGTIAMNNTVQMTAKAAVRVQ